MLRIQNCSIILAAFLMCCILPSGLSAQWVKVNTGTDLFPKTIQYISEDHIYMLATDYVDGWVTYLYESEDGGKTWTEIYKQEDILMSQLLFLDEKVGYMEGLETVEYGDLLWMTRDGGKTWEDIMPDNIENLYDLQMRDSMHGYFTAYHKEYKKTYICSTADGWKSIDTVASDTFFNINTRTFFDYVLFNEMEGYAIGGFNFEGGGDKFYKLVNGSELKLIKDFKGEFFFNDLHFFNSAFGVMVGKDSVQTPVIFLTEDGGEQWKQVYAGEPYRYVYDLTFHGKFGYAVAEDGRIIASTDTGRTWQTVVQNKAIALTGLGMYNERIGCAGGTKGVIYLRTTTAGVESTMEQGQQLSATVYPNPISGNGYMLVNIPAAGAYELRVYDMQGRHAAQPVCGRLAEGENRLLLPVEALSVGTYVAVIEAGGTRSRSIFIKKD